VHELGPGRQPLLSPDGTVVAAPSDARSGPALTLYSTSGSARHTFFDAGAATALPASWSPDSRFLAVVLASTDPVSSRASGLAVIDAHTFASKLIANGPVDGASFAPEGSDRIVYASASSLALSAPVDLFIGSPDRTARQRLTADGRSLNPVWGREGIAFDRERLRPSAAPIYQVWLLTGRRLAQLTNLRVPPLFNGLVPVAFSESGTRLLAEYEGLDTSAAWTIQLAPLWVRKFTERGRTVVGAAISRDGNSLLVDAGGYLSAPWNSAVVQSVPFGGGGARALAHGEEPGWNR
jgi:hypothetical protein